MWQKQTKKLSSACVAPKRNYRTCDTDRLKKEEKKLTLRESHPAPVVYTCNRYYLLPLCLDLTRPSDI